MDVDRPTRKHFISSAPSSSSGKRAKFILPQAQLTAFNNNIASHSHGEFWEHRLQAAKADHSLWPYLISNVLTSISRELGKTDMRGRVVTNLDSELAKGIVAGSSKEELEQLKDGVRNGVEHGDWGGIIEHLKLENPSMLHSTGLVNPETQWEALSAAWNGEYRGSNHRLLLTNINKMKRNTPYSNSVTILQSSGTGKSRMVHELSELVFTLPFNLRLHAESKDYAYPPPDAEIRDYLDWAGPGLQQYEARYLVLLGHLFQAVSEELDKLYTDKVPTYGDLAAGWHKYLNEDMNRSRIYAKATYNCKTVDLDLDKAQVTALSATTSQLEQLLKRIDDCCESVEDCQNNHVKLMVSFDEAHVLARRPVPNDHEEKNTYDVLNSCFDSLLSCPIFVIYLSTTSSMSQLAPVGSLARSARARELQAPITETPFDCSPVFPIKPGQLGLEDISEVEFLAQFGRPLFWTLLAGAHKIKDQIAKRIVDLARAKLIFRHKISISHTELTPAAVSAVLDVLLSLDFEPRRQATRDREAELVASHMRTVFSVPKDRQYIRSGYPSEPLLAEAAARQMDEFQLFVDPETNVMAHLLRAEFNSGLLDQGQRGEVVFRLLLSTAYRRAVREDHAKGSPPYHFSKGCKLTTFIKKLFSEDYADQILNSVPDNVKNPTAFKTRFENAVVRFTHFGKMADDTGTTTHAMFAAFIRCMAVICWSSQSDADVLIPVLLERAKKLEESAMTGLLIQIKRRIKRGSVNQYEISQKQVGFFPPDSPGDDRPYITLVAELGVQPPISAAATTPSLTRANILKSAPDPPKAPAVTKVSQTSPERLHIPEQPARISHPRDIHPRYNIFVYGCSNKVYSVISQSDTPVYAFLLGNKDMLDEHPRSDAKSIRAVRTLKPFWSAGVDCYHWIDNEFLQKYQALSDIGEGLFVGQYEEKDSEPQTDQST